MILHRRMDSRRAQAVYPLMLTALDDEAPDIVFERPILVVGRSPQCDVVVDSKKISRNHCCVAQRKDCLLVRDLDSTNGVRINGAKLQEGKLTEGDELTIGNLRFLCQRQDPSSRPRPARAATAVSDADLEEADEPVLLAEPAVPPPPVPPPPAPSPHPLPRSSSPPAPARAVPVPPASSRPAPPPPVAPVPKPESGAYHIPEDVRLAPEYDDEKTVQKPTPEE